MKGIVDPWRVVIPVKPPKAPPPKSRERISLSEIDFDADLRVVEHCVFKSNHGSIMVEGVDITSQDTGLRALARCLHDISHISEGKALLDKAGIGYIVDGKAPLDCVGLQTSEGTPYVVIYFINQPLSHGILRLIKMLNAVQRRPGTAGADILKRWGVTPMMR